LGPLCYMRIFIIMVTIYTLTDPVTNKIRYVGKTTTDLDKRLRYHIYEINRSKNKHKIYWFKQLINIGYNKHPFSFFINC
jgi:hypothetical protein